VTAASPHTVTPCSKVACHKRFSYVLWSGLTTSSEHSDRRIVYIFKDGRTPKASELEEYAQEQGWNRSKTEKSPIKYTDENGVVRITIKRGSDRAPGSGDPTWRFGIPMEFESIQREIL
jgi:hypothetical protein